MVTRFSVGKSSYGDLRGVEQYVSTARVALQVLSVIADFNAWQKARTAVGQLTVNEGMRSRPRQSYLYVNRFVLGVVVAPPFTSRHDEVLHGNAIDFGITMPDGSNRALTAVEFAKLHELVEARGGTWPAWAKTAPEPWHHEMATRAEQLPPYPNAQQIVNGGPVTPPTISKPAPPQEEDDDMKIVRNGAKGTPGFGAYFAIAPGQCQYLDASGLRRAQQLSGLDPNNKKKQAHFDAGDLNTLISFFRGYGIPPEAANANWLLGNPSGDGKGLWTRAGENATRILKALEGKK
jgi:hypothetical protein